MKRPITLIIAAVLVLVMVLLSAVWPLVGGNQLLGMPTGGGNRSGGVNGRIPNGTFQGNLPQNGQSQGNSSINGSQTGTRTGGSINQSGLMQLTRILQYGLYAVIIILGLIAFGGLWTWKRWGIVMAIITAAVVLIATIPGMFRFFSIVTLIENILKVLLAIAVIVLVVLPKSKPIQATVV